MLAAAAVGLVLAGAAITARAQNYGYYGSWGLPLLPQLPPIYTPAPPPIDYWTPSASSRLLETQLPRTRSCFVTDLGSGMYIRTCQ